MRSLVIAGLMAVSVQAAYAQSQSPRAALQPGNSVLLAAYTCAPEQLDQADALMKEVAAPILDKHVAAGRLLAWGYMGVYLGGEANRHVYVWATDPAALIAARQQYLPELNKNPKFADYGRICGPSTVSVHNLISLSAPPK